MPKVDDCISLFLGSYSKYREEHKKNHGTYWYTPSWIENTSMPSEQCNKAMHKEYVKLYGEDNADFLLETMLSIKNYSRAGYIEWDELPFPKYEEYTRKAAEYYGWTFEKIKGDKNFVKDLIDGNWDERFLIVKPNERIVADYDGNVIKSEK